MAIKYITRHARRGFTLIEVLFSLSVCLLIICNMFPVLKLVSAKDKVAITSSTSAIAARQISKILYTSKEIVAKDSLSYKDESNKQFNISINNKRLVKEPGFDIITYDVDSVNFYNNDNKIYMNITIKGNSYTYLIGIDYQKEDQKNAEDKTKG